MRFRQLVAVWVSQRKARSATRVSFGLILLSFMFWPVLFTLWCSFYASLLSLSPLLTGPPSIQHIYFNDSIKPLLALHSRGRVSSSVASTETLGEAPGWREVTEGVSVTLGSRSVGVFFSNRHSPSDRCCSWLHVELQHGDGELNHEGLLTLVLATWGFK